MRRPAEFADFPESIRTDYGPYMAIVRYVVDGDTIDVLASVGFNDYPYRTVRLLGPSLDIGVDAPERRTETMDAWRAAKAWLEAKLPPGTPVKLETKPDPDSFGRYLAVVTMADGVDVGSALVAAGHAVFTTRWN